MDIGQTEQKGNVGSTEKVNQIDQGFKKTKMLDLEEQTKLIMSSKSDCKGVIRDHYLVCT